jgi:hypothetical protein
MDGRGRRWARLARESSWSPKSRPSSDQWQLANCYSSPGSTTCSELGRDARRLAGGSKSRSEMETDAAGLCNDRRIHPGGANEATALEAHFRIFELRRTAVGPGPYANGWIPAPVTNRRLSRAEQQEINRLGRKFGCHRCGTFNPGTRSGNFVGDHQMSKSLGRPTRIYPHCIHCSSSQGGLLSGERYK